MVDDERGENREQPYGYLPQTVINPDEDPDKQLRGVTRDESKHGFSAVFSPPFPYEEGDVVDVRTGYRRAWAEIVWTRNVMGEEELVGFKIPPSNLPEGPGV